MAKGNRGKKGAEQGIDDILTELAQETESVKAKEQEQQAAVAQESVQTPEQLEQKEAQELQAEIAELSTLAQETTAEITLHDEKGQLRVAEAGGTEIQKTEAAEAGQTLVTETQEAEAELTATLKNIVTETQKEVLPENSSQETADLKQSVKWKNAEKRKLEETKKNTPRKPLTAHGVKKMMDAVDTKVAKENLESELATKNAVSEAEDARIRAEEDAARAIRAKELEPQAEKQSEAIETTPEATETPTETETTKEKVASQSETQTETPASTKELLEELREAGIDTRNFKEKTLDWLRAGKAYAKRKIQEDIAVSKTVGAMDALRTGWHEWFMEGAEKKVGKARDIMNAAEARTQKLETLRAKQIALAEKAKAKAGAGAGSIDAGLTKSLRGIDSELGKLKKERELALNDLKFYESKLARYSENRKAVVDQITERFDGLMRPYTEKRDKLVEQKEKLEAIIAERTVDCAEYEKELQELEDAGLSKDATAFVRDELAKYRKELKQAEKDLAKVETGGILGAVGFGGLENMNRTIGFWDAYKNRYSEKQEQNETPENAAKASETARATTATEEGPEGEPKKKRKKKKGVAAEEIAEKTETALEQAERAALSGFTAEGGELEKTLGERAYISLKKGTVKSTELVPIVRSIAKFADAQARGDEQEITSALFAYKTELEKKNLVAAVDGDWNSAFESLLNAFGNAFEERTGSLYPRARFDGLRDAFERAEEQLTTEAAKRS